MHHAIPLRSRSCTSTSCARMQHFLVGSAPHESTSLAYTILSLTPVATHTIHLSRPYGGCKSSSLAQGGVSGGWGRHSLPRGRPPPLASGTRVGTVGSGAGGVSSSGRPASWRPASPASAGAATAQWGPSSVPYRLVIRRAAAGATPTHALRSGPMARRRTFAV